MAIKKYSKVKFTLRKELIFILAAIVLLVVATILLNLPTEEEKFIKKWNEAGSSITENVIYEEVTFDELKAALDTKGETEYTYVLYATTSDENAVSLFDQIYSIVTSVQDFEHITHIYLVDSGADFDKTQVEENFKDAKGDSINLETSYNLWLFQGNTIVGSINEYTDLGLGMNEAIINMLVKTHA